MDIWECALGFMDAQILLAAEELGVFAALADGPLTMPDIARRTGLERDPTMRLLTALCALELLRRLPDGSYANGPEAQGQLVPGKPGYIGTMFHHLREDLYPLWHYFKETLQERRPQWERAFPDRDAPTVEMYSDPQALRAFMDGMHAITARAGREFAAAAPELRGVRRLVDVGGASGAFAIALAGAFPGMEAVIVDLPQVRPIAADHVRRSGLDGRITFHAADFFHEPLPRGADAYSLGFILHDWTTRQGSYLLGQIAEAIAPGGLLIVGEYLLNEDRTGPLFVARSDLNMLVAARGRERTAREYADWLAGHGFVVERIRPTSWGKHFIVARRALPPAGA